MSIITILVILIIASLLIWFLFDDFALLWLPYIWFIIFVGLGLMYAQPVMNFIQNLVRG